MELEIVSVDHFGIIWERYKVGACAPLYLASDVWSVEYDKNQQHWNLWKNADSVFQSDIPLLVFMVAREMIFEHAANGFSPWWI